MKHFVCTALLFLFVDFVPGFSWAEADLKIKTVLGIPAVLSWNDPAPLLIVIVENVGTTAAAPIKIKVNCDLKHLNYTSHPQIFNKSWPSIYLPELKPGELVTLEQARWPGSDQGNLEVGNYHLIFKVDPANQVSESNEANNEYHVHFNVNYSKITNFSLTLAPKNYTGHCPQNNITIAQGKITALQGSGKVRWVYLTSWDDPNKPHHEYEIRLKQGESRDLGMKSVAQDNFSGWVQVKVIYPTVKLSSKANFTIKCVNLNYNLKKVTPKKIVIPVK